MAAILSRLKCVNWNVRGPSYLGLTEQFSTLRGLIKNDLYIGWANPPHTIEQLA